MGDLHMETGWEMVAVFATTCFFCNGNGMIGVLEQLKQSSTQ